MFVSFLKAVFHFCGALALLLYGMNLLSAGAQKGAGDRLRRLLKVVSGNRFTAVLTGLVVTAVIQSSSAATVMVVSFVNAGILSLTQAIGIIFGANIGTTVTAWIVALFGFSFSVTSFALPLFGIGFAAASLKKWRFRDWGEILMGFGMLFLGLSLLSSTLRLSPSSSAFLQRFSGRGLPGILAGILGGAVITMLIHSSSAMTAIILTMAHNGSLSWEFSAALVLGSNIGTTVDAILSSVGAGAAARRAALVHLGFNVVGTALACFVFRPLLGLVDLIVPGAPQENIAGHIAMLHTVFNLCCTVLFLPFTNQIAAAVTGLVRESPAGAEAAYRMPVIVSGRNGSAELCVMQAAVEIEKMAARVGEIFGAVLTVMRERRRKGDFGAVSDMESYIDGMNEEITAFLVRCSQMNGAGGNVQSQISRLLHETDLLECLSDECAGIAHTLRKYLEKGQPFKTADHEKLFSYMEQARKFFDYTAFRMGAGLSLPELDEAAGMEREIDRAQKFLTKIARRRLESGGNVKTALYYIDLVRRVEKAGDYIYSLAGVCARAARRL